jgi:16S rRNA (cytosine1402-N4)-methyltransferase
VRFAAMVYHIPVLSQQVVEGLQVRAGGSYIDCTVGEGGHAASILAASSPGGRLLGIDLNPRALQVAEKELYFYRDSFVLVNDNFNDIRRIARDQGVYSADGVLFDLGLSSLLLEGEGRGFSFRKEEPLDMRIDIRQELTAWEVVNEYSQDDLTRVIANYGEEHRASRIAEAIVASRPIDTSLRLAQVLERTGRRPRSRIHPATRVFQAIRMEVNRELDNLEVALKQALSILVSGARLVVISYHSLEDRLVKGFLRHESREWKSMRLITKKIISPSREEVRINPRSRSARMRVAERI